MKICKGTTPKPELEHGDVVEFTKDYSFWSKDGKRYKHYYKGDLALVGPAMDKYADHWDISLTRLSDGRTTVHPEASTILNAIRKVAGCFTVEEE